MSSSPRLFCFGLGYVATRLARRLAGRGFAIVGTTRDVEAKAKQLADDPATRDWQLVHFDGDAPLAGSPTCRRRGSTEITGGPGSTRTRRAGPARSGPGGG